MRRTTLVRPQAIVVIVVVLVLLSRGEVRFVPDASTQDPSPPADQVAAAAETPPVPASPLPTATMTPSPTPTPVPPTPTPFPTPTPEPTPTPVPVPTERPPVPPPGRTDRAVIVDQPGTGRNAIAITFDAGDGRGHVPEILDMLDRYGAMATFGVTGEWARANPDLVRAIVGDGHQIINHSFHHESFTGTSTGTAPLSHAEVKAEVLDTEQAIWEVAHYEVAPYFRFPYGDYDADTLTWLGQLGYAYTIWWGCDSQAWNGHTAAQIVQDCGVDKLAPGLIVLLHVDQDADFQALPGLIEHYQAAGYDLVTVEQLIQP